MGDGNKYLASLVTTIPKMRHDLLEYDRLVNLRVVLKNSMNNITSTNGQYQIQKQIDAVEEEFKMVFEDIKTEFALLMALENEYVAGEQGANDVVNQEQDQSCQPGLSEQDDNDVVDQEQDDNDIVDEEQNEIDAVIEEEQDGDDAEKQKINGIDKQ
ncbi:unnamed protein product [Rotaria sordida]|uniref:Uncharacterized protein n=1 Tax=Rotaria sordida TaxID=392033 RepID=A0A815V419_9BILA|nr:unnamed protein product [Rotaria sordida]CAF1662613.1 unnamed protein product [Rotaria sordida]